jgi:pimeloyl-ACP methyl ester carboxylesterase
MTRTTSLCGSLAAVLGLIVWSAASQPMAHAADSPSARRGIVYVVDGAGGFAATSRTVAKTIAEENMPLEVRSFRWTHGYCRVISDQVHAAHVRREGRKLAEVIASCRQEYPALPIFIVAHSAGCAVVLIAAENLPPNTVERIVLLAPAVSIKRDLKPGLRCACQGVDVFISDYDWAWLGLGTLVAGTTDRRWAMRAAGKAGFQPPLVGGEEEALFSKLRQYPWDPSLMWTGHNGGHYGAYQPGFLRIFVLPLLVPGCAGG